MPAERLHVAGIVQGVGFRPFVYGLAHRYGLRGWVRNHTRGVEIAVAGSQAALQAEAPPLARIRRLTRSPLPESRVDGDFRILPSQAEEDFTWCLSTSPPAPTACGNCSPPRPALSLPLHQLHQLRAALQHHPRLALRPPAGHHGRLYRVPGLPGRVRRPAEPPFPRPTQRRPGLRPALVVRRRGRWAHRADSDEALSTAARWWRAGRIVALKGLGTFHLACDATQAQAV